MQQHQQSSNSQLLSLLRSERPAASSTDEMLGSWLTHSAEQASRYGGANRSGFDEEEAFARRMG